MPRRFLLSLSLTLVLLGCEVDVGDGPGNGSEDGAVEDADPNRRVLVEVAPVALGSVRDELATTGVLESEAQADIIPEASGTVTQVLAEEGDSVRKGQVLAIIQNPSLDAGAERAKIELEGIRLAATEAERLHAQGAISDRELRDAKAALRTAESTFGEATKSKGFTRLRSPIAGTVSVRDVRVGELAGGARAFQVVDLERLRVVVQLPEKDLGRISVGQSAALAGAYDDSTSVLGTVERVSPVVDPMTGTVRVTVAVHDSDQSGTIALRPGQFVKVQLEVDRHDDVLTIPRRALVWEDGDPIAWMVVEAHPPEPPEGEEDPDAEDEDEGPDLMAQISTFFEETFADEADADEGDEAEAEDEDPWAGIPRRGVEKARLELGYADQDHVEIISGLEEGTDVVHVGTATLREDTLVRLPEDPAPDRSAKKDEDGGKGRKGRKGKRG